MKKNLSIIVSSTRPKRVGAPVSAWAAEQLGEDWNVNLLDLAEINLPFLTEELMAGTGVYTMHHTLSWKQKIDATDAIVVVNAEYNGFPTPSLINAIDYLLAEWENKPFAIVGYGFGGGQRSTAALTQLLTNVKANPVGDMALFFGQDLTPEGELNISEEKVAELKALSAQLAEALAEEAAA